MKKNILNTVKVIALLCLVISLYSCATRQKYVNQQQSWIGKTITNYVKAFGYPNNTILVDDNPNIETYIYTKTAVDPHTSAFKGSALHRLIVAKSNPQYVQLGALKCTTWVSFNKNTKVIKNITFRGNHCVTSTK